MAEISGVKKIGLITCIGLIAGNMMGSGIALLPATLMSTGSCTLISWFIALVGGMALALVYARLAMVDPQSGGPIAYAGEVAPILGHQTGVLYYHANWIGNLAIAVTGIGYLSTFFPILGTTWGNTCGVILVVWIFTFLNLLGASTIARLTTIGLVLILIPVVGTAIFGWIDFHPSVYMANWNVTGTSTTHAVLANIVPCLWAFVGVESASVSTGQVKNPKRTVTIATIAGTALAGGVYILATQVMAGMVPAHQMATSSAPFALSTSIIAGNWTPKIVGLFTAIACFTSLGSWQMLVGEAGKRAANDGYFPKIYGEVNQNGVAKKGLILAALKMTVLAILMAWAKGESAGASGLFTELTAIAVLLTLLPYIYSCINLIRWEGANVGNIGFTLAGLVGITFCLLALVGGKGPAIIGTFVVSIIIFVFYANRLGRRQAKDKAISA